MKDYRKDLVRGSLIGGAAGDALGYAVEFDSYNSIIKKYGKPGITKYELTDGVAQISDDTQMTLFTANGMLMGLTRGYMRGIGGYPPNYVVYAYEDWYYTQVDTFENQQKEEFHHTWLSALPQLYSRRAPGRTCMTAITSIINKEEPKNNSKGCGGVMRVAPWGLFCACHDNYLTQEETDIAGGEMARLTHKHPLGWIPAIIMTHILYRIVKEGDMSSLKKNDARKRFDDIVNEALDELPELIIKETLSEYTWDKDATLDQAFHNDVERQRELLERALDLADNNQPDIDNIQKLGEGWVGEETLAIAVYCVARHIDNFEDAIIASVNHDGDSDSTGSVAGNIIGAILGYDAIPSKFKKNLELHDVILAIADDLHQGCIISEFDAEDTPEKRQWYERYCMMQPAGIIK